MDLTQLDVALGPAELVISFTAAGDIPSELRADYPTYGYYLILDTDADRVGDFRVGIGFDDGWHTVLFDGATGATTSFDNASIEGSTLTASIPLSALGSPAGMHVFGQVQAQQGDGPVWVDRVPEDIADLLTLGQAEELPEPFPKASDLLSSLLGASKRQEFSPVKWQSIRRRIDRLWKEHGDTLARESDLDRRDVNSTVKIMRSGRTPGAPKGLDRLALLQERIIASGGLISILLGTYSEVDDPGLKSALVEIATAARDYAVVGVAKPSDWNWKFSLRQLREWTGVAPDVIPDLFAKVSANPGPGGTVSWGYGASDVVVDVTTPDGGDIAIRETRTGGSSPNTQLGESLAIVTTQKGSIDQPLRLVFRLKADVASAEGVTPGALVVELDGDSVPDCATPGGGVADPSPCVDARDQLPEDGIRQVVLANQGGTFNLARATTKDDCKDGGWSRLTDADGKPFRIQGDCIAYFKRQR